MIACSGVQYLQLRINSADVKSDTLIDYHVSYKFAEALSMTCDERLYVCAVFAAAPTSTATAS